MSAALRWPFDDDSPGVDIHTRIARAQQEADHAHMKAQLARLRADQHASLAKSGRPDSDSTGVQGSAHALRTDRVQALRSRYGRDWSRSAISPDEIDLYTLWHVMTLRLCARAASLPPSTLTREEFQLLLGCSRNAMLVKRLFDILDVDRDGVVSRDDFVLGMLPMASQAATFEERTGLLFQLFDLEDGEAVSRASLEVHLHLSFGSRDEEEGSFTSQQLEEMVDITFEQADLDAHGRISLASFAQLMRSKPALADRLLQQLTANIDHAIASHLEALSYRAGSPTDSWASSSGPREADGESFAPGCLAKLCRPSEEPSTVLTILPHRSKVAQHGGRAAPAGALKLSPAK
jgi:Ca2+-binding EF-hand superfamily protein